MAEVLVFVSAVQATTQLVEQAFRIIARLRSAHQRQKALVDVLARHENELKGVKTLIGIIDDEEELHTPSVAEELVRLQDVQGKLAKMLESLDPKQRNKAAQLARQLVHGSADEKKLAAIMDELVHVKAMLLLRIQVSSVGVMRNIEQGLVANAEVIQRIDQSLREHINDCEGLRIARLLKGRRPSNDGLVPLTKADLKALSREANDNDEDSEDETLVDDTEGPVRHIPAKTERIILRNAARHQAVQINAAIEEDIWAHIDRLVIKENTAEDQCLQVNYPTSLDITMLMLEVQSGRIGVPMPRRERKRYDSVLSN
ncbi:hypothetical protein BKA63DRAFT_161409 [Paraphoma chrysanthemicola]|nr:hypothetical protein BKA63DRAFT_161409 [Paraphoma chrysanthemicola]